ncbi:AsmA family protein [Cucumibacter marinus]|uniref:AsmA family protein n=1 Tax=Cucumibacter marinus TaxID=1121252 RepID=UPI00040EAC0F|nr:AsmA family protein [Cucumibacter marinus]
MLNRLFIVIGGLAIILLVAAFLVPRFYDWNPYRERMEEIAEEALGAPVTIRGNMEFILLPQPQLVLNDVVLGPDDSPSAEIKLVEAEFALMEFLRDRYEVTQLRVIDPVLNLSIGQGGTLAAPIRLASEVRATNVSVSDATISGGRINVEDTRSEEVWSLSGIETSLKIAALRGPFTAQGEALFGDEPIRFNITTSDQNEAGDIRVGMILRPGQQPFTLSTDGVLSTAEGHPAYNGNLTYRQRPSRVGDPDAVRGDAVLEGTVEADAERLLISAFTLMPDENRPGTRLTGAVDITLGADRRFQAVVSGGVVSLEQQDVREVSADDPYEVLSLFDGLPALPDIGLPGEVGLDVAELDYRGMALRDLRLDATTDGDVWQIGTLTGRLNGDTQLTLSGATAEPESETRFAGRIGLEGDRLDVLSRLWRPFSDQSLLFGEPFSFNADLRVTDGGVRLEDGKFALAGADIDLSARILRGMSTAAEAEIALGSLNAEQSRFLSALLPEIRRDGSFVASFPAGSLTVAADTVFWEGQPITSFDAAFDWSPVGVDVDRFRIGDLAGVQLRANGSVHGTLLDPRFEGEAQLDVAGAADTDAALSVLPEFGQAEVLAAWLDKNRPLRLDATLTIPEEGGQSLSLDGVVADVSMAAELTLSNGIVGTFDSPSRLAVVLDGPSPDSLLAALGAVDPVVAATAPAGQERAQLRWQSDGTATNSLEATITFTQGQDTARYQGSVIMSNFPEFSGRGQASVTLDDPGQFAQLLGLPATSMPALEAEGELRLTSGGEIIVSGLNGRFADTALSGDVSVFAQDGTRNYSGNVTLGETGVAALAGYLAGGASLLQGDEVWPIGPLDLSAAEEPTQGRITISVGQLSVAPNAVLTDVGFDLVWDANERRIRGLTGGLGEGEVEADIRLCCASALADKQVSGRFALDGVDIDALLPPAAAQNLGGYVVASGQFTGSGTTIDEIVDNLGGEGGFSIDSLSIERFSPAVFVALSGMDNIADLSPDDLTGVVEAALREGPLEAGGIEGAFSIVSGALRVSNVAAETPRVRLLGGGDLNLETTELDGTWTMTPTGPLGGNGYITPTTGEVAALIGGTLAAPEAEINTTTMVDAIRVRALQDELDELERLRDEAEQRSRELAAEQQRRLEEEAARQARLAEEEAARQEAARQEAARQEAARQEAERQAAEQAAQQQQQSSGPTPPANVGQGTQQDEAPILLIPDLLFE